MSPLVTERYISFNDLVFHVKGCSIVEYCIKLDNKVQNYLYFNYLVNQRISSGML